MQVVLKRHSPDTLQQRHLATWHHGDALLLELTLALLGLRPS